MELEGDVLDVLQKYVLPEMDSDLPIGQQNELFFTLDKISEYHPDVAVLHIQAMDKMVAYLNARFSVLCGEELVAELKLSQLKEPLGKSPVERYVDMIAFQNIVAYLEKSFSNLKILAESREETEEEKEKRLEMDSTK
uniref:Uncharacterized protein n=1 Tax=uncultured marine virus TaxID=186617 RepID=A0A0F7L5Z4_9VIRU|nr:hypothetical protein [uncultured marine virus]